MIQNQFVTTESSFIDMRWWDECVDPQARPAVADKELPVWVGVDASVKRDSTAIVACTWDKAGKRARLVWHRVFQPSPDEPLDFEATIEATVLELMQRFRVRECRYDPFQMAAVAQRLQVRNVPMVEFAQTLSNLTAMGSNLYELIKGRNLVVYPDASLRLAVSRAVAIETSRGWRIAKEKASHKIDVVVALAFAALGAVQGGIQGSELWQRSALPVVEMPVRADLVYASVITSKTGDMAGVAYFSARRLPGAAIVCLDCAQGPLTPFLLQEILQQLSELRARLSCLGTAIFTSAELAAQFERLGYRALVIDRIAKDVVLPVSVASQVAASRVQICAAVLSKSSVPLSFLQGSGFDDGSPLRLAFLVGVAVGLDTGRAAA
jgi:hypothetical protein